MNEDQILLRLKRKYTKDEEVSFILKALADAQFENGVLKSEIAELKANKRVEKKKAEKPKEPAYPETVVNNFIVIGLGDVWWHCIKFQFTDNVYATKYTPSPCYAYVPTYLR